MSVFVECFGIFVTVFIRLDPRCLFIKSDLCEKIAKETSLGPGTEFRMISHNQNEIANILDQVLWEH